MKKNRWTLLAVLLGMMVAMAGCFGGGRIPTGGVIGYVYAPRTDITDSTKGQLVVKALEIQPGDESKYERLPGATVKSTGTTRTATTDTYGRCSKGNCFENIRSPFKAAVDVNLELVKDLRTVLP